MTTFSARMRSSSITYTPDPIKAGGETYQVSITFPMPREERICVEGFDGRAIPQVEVTPESTGILRHWYFGGRDALPPSANTAVEAVVRLAMEKEHAIAAGQAILPVPTDVVARYRAIDPDISVTDIRRAVQIYVMMLDGLPGATERTAAWIARNFITPAENTAEVNESYEDGYEAGERTGKDGGYEKGFEDGQRAAGNDQADAVADLVDRIRVHGTSVLAFRPGATDLEKFLDAVDAA